MYTGRKTELGKLRKYEQELTALYTEAILRKHLEEAKAIFARRHALRRAILQHEEWHVEGDSGEIVELPHELPREVALEEELARVSQTHSSSPGCAG
jgi:hypothetical protein